MAAEPADHRLPRHVVPHRYEVEWDVDLAAGTFLGNVVVEADVLETCDAVVLHAVDLEVEAAWLVADGITRELDVEALAELEQLRLTPGSPLRPGPVELHLRYRGALGDQLVGLYRSTAVVDGVEHPVAVTQFESTHARRALPCFDEPAFKAVFGVSAVVDADQTVVSNASEVSRTPVADGRARVCFADTVVMSTYLLALVVGPFEATPPRLVEGAGGTVPLRVVHLPGQGHLCEFALDAAESALRWFEEYYGLPYPGDKVDLVAVPDFAFGAMENLGCVTFREVLLLVDPDRATRAELQRVADVVAHELAHMWFGDLVTMGWWNGIWLNEAFATFMEVMATDEFRPEWDVWTHFGLARTEAFDTDALAATRPVEYPVVTAADAEGMFDILTYEKGASVVRMLEQYVGPAAFRAGIAAYLERHAWGNTETTDLWDAVEESTGEPVRRVMDAWIYRGGHPCVTVSLDGRTVRLDQRRAATRPAAGVDPAPAQRWPVPVVLTAGTDDGAEQVVRLLLEDPAEVQLDVPATWVVANTGAAGFYRVEPSADLRRALAGRRDRPAAERFALLDDVWASLVAGTLGARDVLEVVALAAPGEEDPAVWRRLARALRDLAALAGPAHRGPVTDVVRQAAAPALVAAQDRLAGGHDDRAAEVRETLYALMGTLGHDAAVQADARSRWRTEPDPALQAAALSVVAAGAGPEEFAELEAAWRTAATPQDELRHLHAMADVADAALLGRTLDLAVTEVRPQNAPYLLRRALAHPDHGALAWARVRDEWDHLLARFAAVSCARMLEGVRSFCDPALADDVAGFLDAHPLAVAGRQVAQHLERMRVNVAVAAAVRSELAD